jgi:ribosome-associated protein
MDAQTSKSELKRRAKGLEELARELADLPPGEIAALPCDQELRDQIVAGKNLKGGARKRQLKYVTKLLRTRSVEELYDLLARKKGSMLKEKRRFQLLEHLRNLLISEAIQLFEEKTQVNGFIQEHGSLDFLHDSETVQAIVKQLPEVDQFQLRNAAIQYARTRNRKFSRELFRIMKAADEKKQFSQPQDK